MFAALRGSIALCLATMTETLCHPKTGKKLYISQKLIARFGPSSKCKQCEAPWSALRHTQDCKDRFRQLIHEHSNDEFDDCGAVCYYGAKTGRNRWHPRFYPYNPGNLSEDDCADAVEKHTQASLSKKDDEYDDKPSPKRLCTDYSPSFNHKPGVINDYDHGHAGSSTDVGDAEVSDCSPPALESHASSANDDDEQLRMSNTIQAGVSGLNSAPVQGSIAGVTVVQRPPAATMQAQLQQPAWQTAVRPCQILSEVSEDSVHSNQGACSEEPSPKMNLEEEQGKLSSQAATTRERMLEFADNLRSHHFRHVSIGQRPTMAMLKALEALKAKATKLRLPVIWHQIQSDITAFHDLARFRRAIQDVGFHLVEFRRPKVPTFLKAYKQAATHDMWLRRFGVDLVTAFHAETVQACLDKHVANVSFEHVIVLQSQMGKQPFVRWSPDMISVFQLHVATAGLRRAMFIASSQVGDNTYRALIAWLPTGLAPEVVVVAIGRM